MFQWRLNAPRWDFAHVQGDVNPHILHMRKCTLLFDVAHLYPAKVADRLPKVELCKVELLKTDFTPDLVTVWTYVLDF